MMRTARFYFLYSFVLILTGIVLFQSINTQHLKYPDKITPAFRAYVKGKIVNVLMKKKNYTRLLLKGDFDANIFEKMHDVRILLTIYGRGQGKLNLQQGDFIQANVNAEVPRKAILADDFDERAYAHSADFVFFTDAFASEVGIIKRASGFDRLLNIFRSDIKNRITAFFDSENAGIVKALLTGDKTSISKKTKRQFAQTGTAHVLAISGLHIGIILSLIIVLLAFIRNRTVKFILFSLLLAGFVLLTGAHPSSVRAAMMALFIYIAWLAQRKIVLLNILSFAVVVIILFIPQMVYSVGFQMSVAALLGISILFEPVKKFFSRLLPKDNAIMNFIKTSLSLTFSVSVVVSPIVAYYFHNYSIVSPIANLFIVPIITLVLIFALLTIMFSYIYIPVAYLFAVDTDILLNLIRKINSLLSGISISPSNEILIPVSIVISIVLIYIFYSVNKRQLVFRTGLSIIIIVLLLLVTKETDKSRMRVLPRDDIVVIEWNEADKNLFLLLERKEKSRPGFDYGLQKYIQKINGKKMIIYTGETGKIIADECRNGKQIKTSYVSLKESLKILKRLGQNYILIQKIDI
jgi:competence protein ComEC